MKRTHLAAAVLALAFAAGGARANGVVDAIIGDLRAQGYAQIDISRTLLGRTRIEAESTSYHREIIIDPRTGEILRDYWEVLTDASGQPVTTNPPSVVSGGGLPGTGGGTGSSGSTSDDDDEHDDDSSGSGSSGSNSGSSGSSGSNSGSSGGSGSNSGSSGGSGSNSGSSGGSGGGSSDDSDDD